MEEKMMAFIKGYLTGAKNSLDYQDEKEKAVKTFIYNLEGELERFVKTQRRSEDGREANVPEDDRSE